MVVKKVLLFEPMDTDFGGHYFEHSSTYIKFLLENSYEPIFVLGGRKTEKLEILLKSFNVKYYKLGIPVYKSRSKLPSVIKNPINILMETLRHIKVIEIAEREKVNLIALLTFGVYESLPLYLAHLYKKSYIPSKVIIHTVTINESLSLNLRIITKNFTSLFSLIFLRRLIESHVIKNIILYSDMAEEFYKRNVTKNVIRVLHPINFDYDKFNFTKDYSKNIISANKDSPMLLLLNPDAKGKDITNLFKSLTSIKKDFRIIAVGYMSPSFETKVKKLIDENSLSGNVTVINRFLSTEEKYHYLNASDLILLPYKTAYKKAMATSSILAEAVMMLKPVIITNGVIEGNDLVKNNDLGFVVDDEVGKWSDALNKVLENLEKISSKSKENSLKIRSKFRYSDILKQVFEINTSSDSQQTS